MYSIYYMNKKVKTVRDSKGRFSAPVISQHTWNTLAVMLLLPTLWCLGYFLHTIHPMIAHAQEPTTEKEVCQKMKQGFPVSTDGVSDEELRKICAHYGVRLTAIKHYGN